MYGIQLHYKAFSGQSPWKKPGKADAEQPKFCRSKLEVLHKKEACDAAGHRTHSRIDSLVEGRIEGVEVFGIEPVRRDAQALAEALVVDDLAGAQELDRVAHVGVVGKAQDVVVRHARLLLGGEILVQVGERVAGDGEGRRAERRAGCRDRINAGRVIDEIRVEALRLDLLGRQVARELVDDRADHFEVREFFCADVCQNRAQLGIRHGVALAQITQRSADFTVRPAIM